MTKKSITIKTRLGKLKVVAEVSGHFAIHLAAGVDDGTFSVTHVPTGYSFPMSVHSRAFGRAFIGLLNKQTVDWNIKVPEDFVKKFTEIGSPDSLRG